MKYILAVGLILIGIAVTALLCVVLLNTGAVTVISPLETAIAAAAGTGIKTETTTSDAAGTVSETETLSAAAAGAHIEPAASPSPTVSMMPVSKPVPSVTSAPSPTPAPTPPPQPTVTPAPQPTDPPPPVTVTLSAVGDCTLGRDERNDYAHSFADVYDRHSPEYFFENVVEIFEADDLTIANCEGVLADGGTADDRQYIHRGAGDYAEIFQLGSIETVNLANNHTQDYFQYGLNETRRNLERYGVGFFGKEYIYYAEINGIKVALLGYSSYVIGWQSSIRKSIQQAKDHGAHLIVVSLHGGDDKSHYPNNIQSALSRDAIDCGADLVLGHHPHVIQGIELYEGKYIVYSLGNFSYGGNKNPADKDTFIFQPTYTFNDEKEIIETDIQIYPCRISSVTERNDYRPTPYSGADAQRVYDRLNEYSRPFGFILP
jgi:poly-gamma-glutamate synthesis protein (capsule biosynthesis protein)